MNHDATAAAGLVRDMLAECSAVTRERLRTYLRPGARRAALYDMAADYPERGGRNLRATLCIATARAFGASTHAAVNTAVSLELLHNAFLVHDDVEDESEERRGRPTLHQLHGVPTAINVGDALAVVSLRPLIDNRGTLGPRLTLRILEEAERMARESVEGQAIELGWRRDNSAALSSQDYLHMILKKTCWYTTIYPCRVGALIGTADAVDLDRFMRFGFFLGAAFQIQDDLLNLIGDGKRYGKELGGDIREGKRTLMLIHLLEHVGAAERARLLAFLARPRADKPAAEVTRIIARMHELGSIGFAQQLAHGLAGAALHEHTLAFAQLPDSRDKAFLGALPAWVLARA